MLCKLNQEESKENSGNFKGTETPKEKKTGTNRPASSVLALHQTLLSCSHISLQL